MNGYFPGSFGMKSRVSPSPPPRRLVCLKMSFSIPHHPADGLFLVAAVGGEHRNRSVWHQDHPIVRHRLGGQLADIGHFPSQFPMRSLGFPS